MVAMPARSVALVVLVAAVWGVNFVVIHVGPRALPAAAVQRAAVHVHGGAGDLPRRPAADRVAVRARLRLPARRGQVRAAVREPRPRDAGGLSSLLLQLQVIFTIVFAGVRPARAAAARAGRRRRGRLRRACGDRRRPRGERADPPLPAHPRRRGGVGRDERDHAGGAAARPARDARLGEPRAAAPAARAVAAVRGARPRSATRSRASTPRGSPRSLFVALVSGLFGFAAWTPLLKRHAAAAVTPFALLVPVFGIASAALLLGERPSALELGGAVLICAGLAATLIPRRATRSARPPPPCPAARRSSSRGPRDRPASCWRARGPAAGVRSGGIRSA